MGRLNIEQYALDDFETVEPYKALELIDDAFLKQSEEVRLEARAKAVGYKNFKKMLAAYRKDLKKAAVSVVTAGGLTDFDGDKAPQLSLVSWNADETGIWKVGRDGTREYACKHPIAPKRLLYNIDTGEMKVELWFKR